jgi:hypothetical protein
VLGARIEGASTGGARVEQIQLIRINNNPFTAEDGSYSGFGVPPGGAGGNLQSGGSSTFQSAGGSTSQSGSAGGFQSGSGSSFQNSAGGNFQSGSGGSQVSSGASQSGGASGTTQGRNSIGSGNRGSNERTEVIQRAGTGAFHGIFVTNFQDESLNARNPFAANKPPYHERTISGNLNGPLLRDRLTLNAGVNDNRQENVGTVKAVTLEGPYSLGVTRPNITRSYNAGGILQLYDGQSLHFGGRYGTGDRRNQGIGDFTLPERGTRGAYTSRAFELRQISLLSARAVYETRLTSQQFDYEVQPLTKAVAINVLDAFNGGGAQDNTRLDVQIYDFGNLFYYTGEKATLRAGFDGWHRRDSSITESNFTGEFTFSDLESYRLGKPLKYRVTRGDPLLEMGQLQMGFFVQEDLRITNRFTLMAGARYETQTNLSDRNNLDPRLGFAYAVGGSTVIRGGAAVFHQRVEANAVQQLLRLDGKRQYEILIDNPGWPDPFVSGNLQIVPPASRRVRAPDLVAPYNAITSVSFERTLPANLFLTISAEYNRGVKLLRSRNLNAPLPGTGLKPFPEEGHIYQLESTGKSEYKNVRVSMRQRFSIFNVTGAYTLASANGDVDQPFVLPSNNYDLRADWGRTGFLQKHSFNTAINARLPLDVYLTTSITANSGSRYNVTTGKDDNGDGQTNDRPAGVARNSANGPRFFNVGFNLSKAFRLGGSSVPAGSGRRSGDSGGGAQMSVFLNANNALNMTNPGTPSGVMTSPFFGRSFSAASGPREIAAGLRFQF